MSHFQSISVHWVLRMHQYMKCFDPLLVKIQHYYATLMVALKSWRGPHTSVILGTVGPKFTVRKGPGGHI